MEKTRKRMTLHKPAVRTVLLLALFAIVIAGGLWFYLDQSAQAESQVADELTAIAGLKTDQIVQWRSERLSEAALLGDSQPFIEAVRRWLDDPHPDDEEFIRGRLGAFVTRPAYENALIVDVEGRVLLETVGAPEVLHEEALATLRDVLSTGAPALTELHARPDESDPHMDVIAPLEFDDGGPDGALVFNINAQEFLYPLIQSWPLPSETGETLLVARDGDEVLFLNELRHVEGAALSMRVPLTESDLPAAQAVLGTEGVVRGVDYRGEPVIAVLTAIPDSPWHLVAKVDESEAFAAWRIESRLLLLIAIGIVLSTSGAVAFVWQRDHAAQLQTQLAAERGRLEAEERYGATLMSVGDGVIATDAECRVVLLNPVAEQLTGWSQDEARGRLLEEVFVIINEYTRTPVVNPARDVMRDGAIVGLANHTLLIARDGTERPIADSGAPVRIAEEEPITGVVLVFRDQTEERAAQHAIHLQRDRLEAAERQAGLGSWEYDFQTRRGWWSPQMCRMLGFDPVCGFPGDEEYLERVHPEDRHIVRQLLDDVEGGVTPGPAEYRIDPGDGSERRLSADTRLELDAEGRPVAFAGTVLDVTERAEAQMALQASEEQYAQLFSNLTVGLALHEIITDDEGVPRDYRFLQVNPAFERFTGLAAADVVGRTVLEVMPNTESHWIERYGHVALTGESTRFEEYSRDLDRYYEVLAYSPRPGCFATVVDETTERNRVKNDLGESRRMLRLVLDTIPVGVFWKDSDHRYLGCNRTFADDAGFESPDGVIGKTNLDMPWAESAEVFHASDTAVRESGDALLGYEEPTRMADGRVAWLRTSKLPLVDHDGEIIGVMGNYEDITSLKQARDTLEELNRSLERRVDERTDELQATNEELHATTRELKRINDRLIEAAEAKSSFLRAMSHELRTPLNSIIGFSGVMLQGLAGRLSKEQRRQLQMIDNAGRHLLALINDILDLSRIEAGKIDVSMEPIDIAALADEVVSSVSAAAVAKEIELVLDLPGDLPALVSDERKIRQVLINLLGNALKFTDEGSVRLSVYRPAEAMVAFSVIDTGPGIPEEDHERIFGEFVQGSYNHDPSEEGTGLGLAISRGLAAAMGGMITLDSDYGGGATFTLLLPEAPVEV